MERILKAILVYVISVAAAALMVLICMKLAGPSALTMVAMILLAAVVVAPPVYGICEGCLWLLGYLLKPIAHRIGGWIAQKTGW